MAGLLRQTQQLPDLSSSETSSSFSRPKWFSLSSRSSDNNICSIEDVNDIPPIFKRKTYEGFMTQDLSRLRNNLQVLKNVRIFLEIEFWMFWQLKMFLFQVEAIDLDKRGTQNSHVRYEIIKVPQWEALSPPEKSPIKGSLIILSFLGKLREQVHNWRGEWRDLCGGTVEAARRKNRSICGGDRAGHHIAGDREDITLPVLLMFSMKIELRRTLLWKNKIAP